MGSRAAVVAAVGVLLSVALTLPILVAQQPAERPVFRSRADVVPLDVIVLDKNRHPVRGLTAADFHVVADGDDRPIVIFDAIEMPDRVRGGARWLQDVTPDVTSNGFNPDRIVVLFLDDWNTAPKSDAAIAVRKIGQAILDELQPSDLIAVIYPYQTQRGVDFTRDRSRLREAVERFSVARPPEATGDPSAPSDPDKESGACRNQSCVLGAMRAIANAARLWPDRRKLLVYVSPQGHYTFGPQNVELSSFGRNFAAVDMTPAVMDTIRELQRANVTVYQFDPRGIEEVVDDGVGASVGMFADQTGGSTVTRSNEPWTRAPQMFVENDSYYILGFMASTRESRSGFHPIRVTVNRPGVTVIARRDYYAGRESKEHITSSSDSSGSALDRAMFGLVPASDVPLSISAAPFRVAGARTAAVAIVGGFDRPAGKSDESAEVAVRAFDEKTQLRKSTALWTSKVRLRPQQSASGRVHYDAVTRLDLRPGRYEIRMSMQRAADQLTGGVATFVTVPDFEKDRVSLSGVVLGRPVSKQRESDDPVRVALPFAPTTVRAFVRNEFVTALVRVYQGGRGPLRPASITTHIFNETDEQVFEAPSDLAPEAFVGPTRAAEYQLRLPLATLPAGEYVLKLEATVDKTTVPASPVRFRVRD
jgi:VWFA-related protein